jgi:hypothetical protein
MKDAGGIPICIELLFSGMCTSTVVQEKSTSTRGWSSCCEGINFFVR